MRNIQSALDRIVAHDQVPFPGFRDIGHTPSQKSGTCPGPKHQETVTAPIGVRGRGQGGGCNPSPAMFGNSGKFGQDLRFFGHFCHQCVLETRLY